MVADDPVEKCGISKIWATPETDVFAPACRDHDAAYVEGSEEQRTMTRLQVDERFLYHMLRIAGSSWRLKAKAYLFYGLVRSVGWIWWDNKATR